jgi:hypothetical protein
VRLRRRVLVAGLVAALTVVLAVSSVGSNAEASAARRVHLRATSVTLTTEHFSGGRVDLIAHSAWHHKLADGYIRSGHIAGLPVLFQTYRRGAWVQIFRTARSRSDGTCVIEGYPGARARYRVLVLPTTIGGYRYRGSRSTAIRA